MKTVIVLAILLGIGLIILEYKREQNLKKMILSFGLLTLLLSLGIVGNMMRAIAPLFITHWVALIAGYLGLLIYLLRERFIWYLSLAPVATLLFYLVLSWLGNEHV